MRREGYELQVSRPEVIEKEIDGVKCEPFERVQIDTPEEYMGSVIESLSLRKGLESLLVQLAKIHLFEVLPSNVLQFYEQLRISLLDRQMVNY